MPIHELSIYSCHGAAKQVTGSCHLITCNKRRVLVDCGLAVSAGMDGRRAAKKLFLAHGEFERGMRAIEECLTERGVTCQLPD